MDEAERQAAGEYSAPTGDLIIAAPIVFGRLHVVPIVAEFLKTYPDVDVQLVLEDRPLDLLENHIDLAVRVGELPDSSLIALRVGQIRNVVCASPKISQGTWDSETPKELVNHDCINFTFAALMSPDVWTFRMGKSEMAMRIPSRLVVNTAEAAIDAAIAGVGITRVLSYQVKKAVTIWRAHYGIDELRVRADADQSHLCWTASAAAEAPRFSRLRDAAPQNQTAVGLNRVQRRRLMTGGFGSRCARTRPEPGTGGKSNRLPALG